MLTNLYTTKMSADKKQLQNRFSKIRSENSRFSKTVSALTAVFIITAMLAATVVLAAAESNGLEHHDKNEAYFLAGVTGEAYFTSHSSPEWMKNISDSGNVNVFVKRTDIRETNGLVSHLKTVTLSGNVGSADFFQNSTCGYYGKNGERLLLVFDTSKTAKNPYGEVNTEKIYIKALDKDEYSENEGLDFNDFIESADFNEFTQLTNTREIGNFKNIESEYHNSICINYYTYFENIFNNKSVDGIKLEVSDTENDYIAVTVNIDIPEAYHMQVGICEPNDIPRLGTSKRYSVSEINGKEIRFSNHSRNDGFEKGKTYTVNYVLTDIDDNVIYRQQDFITVR